MTDMSKLTPAQLKYTMEGLQRIREKLSIEAVDGVGSLGFSDVGVRNLAALQVLLGAAQLCALTHRPLYAVFRMLCLSMANEESADVAMRKLEELGPEIYGGPLEEHAKGKIIRPGG